MIQSCIDFDQVAAAVAAARSRSPERFAGMDDSETLALLIQAGLREAEPQFTTRVLIEYGPGYEEYRAAHLIQRFAERLLKGTAVVECHPIQMERDGSP